MLILKRFLQGKVCESVVEEYRANKVRRCEWCRMTDSSDMMKQKERPGREI